MIVVRGIMGVTFNGYLVKAKAFGAGYIEVAKNAQGQDVIAVDNAMTDDPWEGGKKRHQRYEVPLADLQIGKKYLFRWDSHEEVAE